MKIVFNNDYGGFGLGVSKKCKHLIDLANKRNEERTNQDLIEFVENNPDECGDLAVVEIPDAATDWEIRDYDGLEDVVYVLDGKIRYAVAEPEDWD